MDEILTDELTQFCMKQIEPVRYLKKFKNTTLNVFFYLFRNVVFVVGSISATTNFTWLFVTGM